MVLRTVCSACEGAGVIVEEFLVARSFNPATTWSPSSRPSVGSACTASIRVRTAASRSATSRARSCRTARRGFSGNGKDIRHFVGTSTFAEYTVVPEIALAKVSADAPLAACAPFACGLSTGMGAALYTARVTPGSTCVVFGCGLVGLGAVIGCRLAGADRIVAVDLSETRLEEARRHGATDTRVAAEDFVDWIAETGGFGADFTFEATGNVGVMQQAVEAPEARGSQR